MPAPAEQTVYSHMKKARRIWRLAEAIAHFIIGADILWHVANFLAKEFNTLQGILPYLLQ